MEVINLYSGANTAGKIDSELFCVQGKGLSAPRISVVEIAIGCYCYYLLINYCYYVNGIRGCVG